MSKTIVTVLIVIFMGLIYWIGTEVGGYQSDTAYGTSSLTPAISSDPSVSPAVSEDPSYSPAPSEDTTDTTEDTDNEVTQSYYYCWDSGAPEPHHYGHPVSGDHLCTNAELREYGY